MRKIFIIGGMAGLLFACSNKVQQENIITVTIEPQRYLAEQLADSLFRIESMVPAGTSPETYDPTPAQMANLARSKAYFCIGYIGFEEVWIDKLKHNYPQIPFFDNSKGISLVASEDFHEGGIDPHIWSSPKAVRSIVQNMKEAFVAIDPSHESRYAANLQRMLAQVDSVDTAVTQLLHNSSQKAFIIYHPALTYFALDYGLTQYSIEADGKEPSPEQLKTLMKAAKEKGIQTVFVQQEFDQKNAELVAKETGCRIVVINPLSYDWGKEMIHIARALSDE